MPIKKICRGRPVEIDGDHLLDVAEDLFAERGFEGTTTREVAKKAGCNLALISYHFESKPGLYRAVIQRHLGRTAKHLSEAVDRSKQGENLPLEIYSLFSSPAERTFYVSVLAIAEMLIGNEKMQKILCREMMAGAKNMAQALTKSENSIYNLMKGRIDDLQREKIIAQNIDVAIAVICLMGPIIYTCVAMPIFKAVYDIQKADEIYRRRLCVQLTQSFFAQHALRATR